MNRDKRLLNAKRWLEKHDYHVNDSKQPDGDFYIVRKGKKGVGRTVVVDRDPQFDDWMVVLTTEDGCMIGGEDYIRIRQEYMKAYRVIANLLDEGGVKIEDVLEDFRLHASLNEIGWKTRDGKIVIEDDLIPF